MTRDRARKAAVRAIAEATGHSYQHVLQVTREPQPPHLVAISEALFDEAAVRSAWVSAPTAGDRNEGYVELLVDFADRDEATDLDALRARLEARLGQRFVLRLVTEMRSADAGGFEHFMKRARPVVFRS